MAFNNGKTRTGTADRNYYDMNSQYIWDVADNYEGGGGNDTIIGNIADNKIWGGADRDDIDGRWGNDSIWGGLGNDTLRGDAGDDVLRGEENDDVLFGGDGNDKLYGGANNDTLRGGDGADELFGGSGSDWLKGGNGWDKLDGGTGSDTLYGGDGNDTLKDGSGNTYDVLSGGDGIDTITVQGGGDKVLGGEGTDTISIGDAAAFRAAGGTIDGGADSDKLIFRDATDVTLSSDWMTGIEKIDLTAVSNQTLRMSAGELAAISDTDTMRILGEQGDRIFLDDASGQFPGGRWVAGAVSSPDQTGNQTQTWTYVDSSGDVTGISAQIDTDIQVQLV